MVLMLYEDQDYGVLITAPSIASNSTINYRSLSSCCWAVLERNPASEVLTKSRIHQPQMLTKQDRQLAAEVGAATAEQDLSVAQR